MIKRIFDLSLAIVLMIILSPAILVIGVAIKLTSAGPVLFWSERVGLNNHIFRMPKFRTMEINSPNVATHLLTNPERYLTAIGPFLRKTSLDELPQVYSVFRGKMSFVGPRPALFNQDDLIRLRNQYGIEKLMPGLTGWAQINGRDDLPISLKVKFDQEYKSRKNLWFDIKILFLTIQKVISKENVSH